MTLMTFRFGPTRQRPLRSWPLMTETSQFVPFSRVLTGIRFAQRGVVAGDDHVDDQPLELGVRLGGVDRRRGARRAPPWSAGPRRWRGGGSPRGARGRRRTRGARGASRRALPSAYIPGHVWDRCGLNGAESVLRTLVGSGVDVCFANPGTSEMHLVAAMDRVPEMRGVLTLFEGVASGAADGYARMADFPAATLLHLGPGFGNAFANVHNAYKARTPMVNVVGDHAVGHKPLGAPLASRHRVGRAAGLALGADGPRRARRGHGHRAGGRGGACRRGLDADLSRRRGLGAEPRAGRRRCRCASLRRCLGGAIEAVARRRCASGAGALLLGGVTTRGRGLELAARIAAATGAALFRDTFPWRLERGGGRPRPVGGPVSDRDGRRRAVGALAPGAGGDAAAGRVLRLPRAAEPAGRAAHDGARSWRRRRRTRWRRWRRWPRRSARRRPRPLSSALERVGAADRRGARPSTP